MDEQFGGGGGGGGGSPFDNFGGFNFGDFGGGFGGGHGGGHGGRGGWWETWWFPLPVSSLRKKNFIYSENKD